MPNLLDVKIPVSWMALEKESRRGRRVNRLLAGLIVLLVVVGIALEASGEAYTVQTAGDPLNIRSKPWIGAEIVGMLFNGDSVEVVSISDGWALIEAAIEAGGGYVSMDYLNCAPDKVGMYMVDAGGRVRVRKEPNGERVRWLEAGAMVEVVRWQDSNGELWAFVGDGYVLADCLMEAAQ